jgi:hypothetical protein
MMLLALGLLPVSHLYQCSLLEGSDKYLQQQILRVFRGTISAVRTAVRASRRMLRKA